MNPKFSIITVCYNSEKTIERTIISVLAQTYKDYEYIIVDGASDDGTLDIVKKYEYQFDGKMKWRSEPDSGIYDAFNKGILQSSGDIIGIVNSDDWLEPDAFEIVTKAFKENGCNMDALYCGGINYQRTDGSKKRWDVNIKSFKRQAPLYVMSGIRHPAVFVPKQVYKRLGLFDDQMRISADQDFVLRCYLNGVTFYEIKQTLSNMSEGGISTDNSERSNQMVIEDRKHMLKKMGKSGLSYWWLLNSWVFRLYVKRILKK